jgi:hypothetical protein
MPASVNESEEYKAVLLLVTILAVGGGLLVLWRISRRSPRGTVLVLALIVYTVGLSLAEAPVREARLASGICKMLGVTGGILGWIVYVRKGKAEAAAVAAADDTASW